jgi:hypothetical protein
MKKIVLSTNIIRNMEKNIEEKKYETQFVTDVWKRQNTRINRWK